VPLRDAADWARTMAGHERRITQLEHVGSRLRLAVRELQTGAADIADRIDAVECAVVEPQMQAVSGESADAEVDSSVAAETDESDATYFSAAQRVAAAAEYLARTEAKARRARILRQRTRLLLGFFVCLGVALTGTGFVLKRNFDPLPGPLRVMHDGDAIGAGTAHAPASHVRNAPADSGAARSMLDTGLAYLDGTGVARDDARAAQWIAKAAMQGEPLAQYWLGVLFERGRGETADPARALHWYELSAQNGNPRAMNKLALTYAEGRLRPKSFPLAARWFARAAGRGLVNAQYNLGVLYERGLGVPQSLLQAYKWFSIAAAQGDEDSASRVDALSSQMTARDLAAARKAVAAFQPAVGPDARDMQGAKIASTALRVK
jgi:localization factor PodJL